MNRFLAMVAAHAVADYPLQGDFLAKGKNRTAPIPGVPWWQALGAHAIIHGGAVGVITRSPALGIAETVIHAITDDLKCRGKLTYNQDQAIHVACKALWSVIAALHPTTDTRDQGELWQHVKRGGLYEVVGEAELQTATGDLVDGSALVVYRGEDGKLWAREEGEFHDGRFVCATNAQAGGGE